MFIYAFCLLTWISCDKKSGLDFTVYNESDVSIDSVVIRTSGKDARAVIGRIEPDSSGTNFLDMTDVPPVDGQYYVSITAGDTTWEDPIGYYTNGSPFEKKIEIWFSPSDSIRYESTTSTD
jgi:hypothetical protein